MATKVLPNIRREATVQMKNRLLFDIYRREGGQFFRQNKYKEAIVSYNAALEIEQDSKVALMSRSRCYFEMGLIEHSLVDCEAVLAVDNTYPDAVYQKAEIFFALGNYEMALLFYHRGHKLNYSGFQEGIDRCKKAMKQKVSGRTMKLTAAGDLTIYVHKKMQKLGSKASQSGKQTYLRRDPSAVSYKLKVSPNPLVRLDRKDRARAKSYRLANRQGGTDRRIYSDRPVNYRNQTSSENGHGQNGSQSERPVHHEGYGIHDNPDEKTMRIILGKLYGDKEYLEKFVQKTDSQSNFETSIRWLAEDGLGFLYERIMFWSCKSLQPSPPPSPPLSQKHAQQTLREPREKNPSPVPRQRSSLWQREVSEFIRNLESPDGSEDDDVTIEQYKKRIRGSQRTTKAECINFVFKSLRPESAQQRHPGEEVKSRLPQIVEEDALDEDSIHMYLTKELQDIQEAFDKSDYAECTRISTICLQSVKQYSKEEISDKRDLVARVHSYLGNSLLEQHEYDKAIIHHEKDLEIGEECKINEPVSRALGNLGRAYLLKKQYNKALGAFARKTKLATQPVEFAWLFHEIGNCFLCLHQHKHTCACAIKSLDAAVEADNRLYQLQSSVLLAVAQVKLEKFEAAHSTFERALDLASLQGDTQSEELIKVALSDVNQNISRELKDKLHIREESQYALVNNEDTDNDQQQPGSCKNKETSATDNTRQRTGTSKKDGISAKDSTRQRTGTSKKDGMSATNKVSRGTSRQKSRDKESDRMVHKSGRLQTPNDGDTNQEEAKIKQDSINDDKDREHVKTPGAGGNVESSVHERNSLKSGIKSVDGELEKNEPLSLLKGRISSTVDDAESLNHSDFNITGGSYKEEVNIDNHKTGRTDVNEEDDVTSSDKQQQSQADDMTSSNNPREEDDDHDSQSVEEANRKASNATGKTSPPTITDTIQEELHKKQFESEL